MGALRRWITAWLRALGRRGTRGRRGTLGTRGPGDRLRGTARPSAPAIRPLGPDAPLASLAEELDLGISAFVAGPRHALDIEVGELSALLTSTAHHAAARDQRAYVQIPGRCLLLTADTVDAILEDVGRPPRPRLRLLIAGLDGRIVENVGIELWRHSGRAYRSLSDDSPVRLSIPGAEPPSRGPAATESSVDIPIDVVYTWVDSRDPEWRALAAEHLDLAALDDDLYTPTDELRYSLRSLEVFAPWVNHVFVLSNCRPPSWFRPSDRISWIDHGDVMDANLLPLFNSGAIETFLHRLPGLSEHFLYLNDDVMLWDSVTPSTFFTWDGRSIARLASNSSVIYLEQLVEAGRASPSQHSRVNAARLLEDRLGCFPTKLHGHVPLALQRSVLLEIEEAFSDQMAATRASRTRQPGDVSFVAYLSHHYAYATGRAVYAEAPPTFVTVRNYDRPALRQALRDAQFACFQDSRGSAADADYQAAKRDSLERALPLPSFAEMASS